MESSKLRAIIIDGDAETLISEAKVLGEKLVEHQLTTSQIRNIFGTVRRIEMNWPVSSKAAFSTEEERQHIRKAQRRAQRELLLLKPKMAYQAKRERGKGARMLTDVLSEAIDLVDGDRERFQNFVDFFEAILAYHKAYGGK